MRGSIRSAMNLNAVQWPARQIMGKQHLTPKRLALLAHSQLLPKQLDQSTVFSAILI